MYKYRSPHEWLGAYLNGLQGDALRHAAFALASEVGADAVQDLFQSEMIADGYFDSDVICPYAGTTDCSDPEEPCSHRVAHAATEACEAAMACPACVPVEEEQA